MYAKVQALVSQVEPDIYNEVVQHSIIHGGDKTTFTMKALWGYYLSGLVPYENCREQSFGSTGEFTELICSSHDVAGLICENEELCDDSEWKEMPVYAVKGEVFKDIRLTAQILCGSIEQFPYTPGRCPRRVYSQLYDASHKIKHIVQHMPFQFDNELLTLGVIDPTRYSSFGQNRIHGFGDAFLDLRRDIYQDLFDTSIKLQTMEALAIFIRDKYEKLGARGKEYAFTRSQNFLVDVLEGYMLQKFSSRLFTDEERMDKIPAVYDLVEVDCAVYLGAYYAWNCTSLDDFLTYSDTIASSTFFPANGSCDALKGKSNDMDLMIQTGKNTLRYNINTRCTNSCVDTPGKHTIAKDRRQSCDWAVRVNDPGEGGNQRPGRCFQFPKLQEMCPDTCGTCCNKDHISSQDSTKPFRVFNKVRAKRVNQNCNWVKRTQTKFRCSMKGVSDKCRDTCDSCIP